MIFKFILILASVASASALSATGAHLILGSTLSAELQKRYPSAKIELADSQLGGLTFQSPIRRVQLIKEVGQGSAEFLIEDQSGAQQVTQIRFSARISTFVAQRKIRPLEKLSADDFMLQSIDVAQGLAHEYRAMMLPPDAELSKFEARQTILQGQYPLSSGIQRIPDIKRGDTVRVTLLSGEIELSTSGIAQEPAYYDAPVRVLTQKTKKELMGKLLPNGSVEVRL
jgi:flagella basal body P-ring formation protein FlgA